MPPRADLTGKKFGKLSVESRGERVVYGGMDTWTWHCRCDCGTLLTEIQIRLLTARVECCPACAARMCKICGLAFIPTSSRAMTCSPQCQEINRKKNQQEARRLRDADDPARVRRWRKKYRESVKLDPTKARKVKVLKAQWKRQNGPRLRAAEAEKLEAMTLEEREAILAEKRAYHADYSRRQRGEAKNHNLEKYESILARVRGHRHRKALADLTVLGSVLTEKVNK